MDRDEMSNFFRGPSIDAFYQIAVHFGISGFKGVEFKKIDQSETSIACGSHLC
jgi:hypothetical protein